ncbi:reverse transcriptase domain-containing protein [Tanacetum coccineum]
MARTPLNENCSAVILNKLPKKLGDPGRFLIPCEFSGINTCNALADLGASINLMPYSVWKTLSLSELTPTCMTLELADRSISEPIGIAEDVYVTRPYYILNLDKLRVTGCLTIIDVANRIDVIDMACEDLLSEVLGFSDVISRCIHPFYDPIVSTSSPTLTPFGDSDFLLFEEADSFLALEGGRMIHFTRKDLPPHLEYAFLEGDDKLPVILQKDLKNEKRKGSSIPEVLKSHKRKPFAWKLLDFKGINPVLGVACMLDYRKLNEATHKDHFPLPFMDQMLERLAGNDYYCFLDGFSGYIQIPIDPKDQEKTTFMCPYGTFAYHRMPFGLCNAPGTFQRCMLAIFHDMVEKTMEVFMDDFLLFGNSFKNSLSRLDKMLQRKLTEAPILIAPDWDLPFELMCDASDFAIGAVLGQRKNKHFQPIYYASKTMTEAQAHYTTTEKELLAVVYAFEKFRSYLVLPKSIVYTDHSAIKYLFAIKYSFGASTSWDRSHLLEATNTYLWLSTTYQNGLKRKRSPPTTPE